MTQDDLIHAEAEQLYRAGRYEDAFPKYLQLAQAGRFGCQRFVGWMYLHGEGVPKDAGHAYEWFRKAGERGDREAKFGAGKACLALQDSTEAIKWFSEACRIGFPPACFRLSWMHYHGYGVARNVDLAYELASRGYADGHIPSGRLKAVMLLKGHSGALGRLVGLALFARVAAAILVGALMDRESQRFMG